MFSGGHIALEEGDQFVWYLHFDTLQGKYIKTLPLHETQKILLDDENELQISLKVFITHDLVMELLSFGENLMVLHPKELVNSMRETLKKATVKYM